MNRQPEKTGMDTPERRYPKEIVLKGGREVILRPIEDADQSGLCRFYMGLNPLMRWYMKADPCQPAEVEKWIRNHRNGRAFSIVADIEGRIVAHASLLMRPYGGRRHVARLRVYVAEDFRRMQLGTWMVFDLVRYAMNKGMEMIRTDFVVGVEDTAIKAVRKLDFITEGIIKNYVKDEEGNYHDYQIMIKRLHREWSDF